MHNAGGELLLQQVALILTRAHHACTIGRVDFSAEPSVCFMRYGSITLKSAVMGILRSSLSAYRASTGRGYPSGCPGPRPLEESMEHTPTNEPIEDVVSIEGYTKSAGTGFKESLLLSVNPEAEFVDPDEDLDSVFVRRGGAFEEVQSWRPVI